MQRNRNAEGARPLLRWPHAARSARVEPSASRTYMDFFNSLALDLKMLVVAIAGCALLALFSGNHKTEKRYLVAFAVLAAIGVYRFTRVPTGEDRAQRSAAVRSAPQVAPAPAKKAPLTSTSAK
jgi:hypothetical protein